MQAAPAETSTSGALPAKSHAGHHHNRNKKVIDPFLELTDDAVKLPDQPSPNNEGENAGGQSESLLADLVLTPINMISFVVSLMVVDRQQRQWRLSQHASGTESIWYRVTHWSWSEPQPYQESREATWLHDHDNISTQNAPDSSFQGWYTRKKHRAVAKMEISDAFEMRGRVLLALLAWMALGLFGLTYAFRRMYGWISGT